MSKNNMTLDEKIKFIENLIDDYKNKILAPLSSEELYEYSAKISALKEIKETLLDYKSFVDSRNQNKAVYMDIEVENKPTRELILNYCRRMNIDPNIGERFFDYYEKNNLWFNKYGNLINWEFALTKWINYARRKPNIHVEDW